MCSEPPPLFPIHPRQFSNLVIKFADDATVIGLITNDDETAYRSEVENLEKGSQKDNLALNGDKTKELIIDFRRPPRVHNPILIGALLWRGSRNSNSWECTSLMTSPGQCRQSVW